ncbi:hypothetical protein [Actinoplanes subglobosus]|uniref:Uncharacterized protein n=1 Tax=Actinoplanes subglobosus TaxID=1547892 RepID=A0ABV8J7S7_9ACTN
MDRTAPAGVPGEGNSAERLPSRRRQPVRDPEAEGNDKPLGWFGDPKPSESGSISSPVTAPGSPAVPSPRRSPGSSDEGTPSPPEFGPASPGGPGRVSFGFSDGPIGGVRPSRGRVSDDTGGLRRVSDDTGGLRRVSDDTGGLRRVSDDTGGLRRVSDDTGGLRRVSDDDDGGLPQRKRGDVADLSRRGRSARDAAEDLPIIRTTGNGTETPSWSDPDPFSVGIGSLPADAGNAPWPESFDAGPAAPDTKPLWSDSAATTPAGGGWERRDEPVMWAGAAQAPSAPSTLSNGPVSAPPAMRPPRRPSRFVTAGMTLLGLVALAAVALTGVVYYSGDSNQITDIIGGGSDQRVVSGPLEDRTIATFELLAATDRVQLRLADLGDDLYRISAPEGAGIKPSAEVRDDRLRVDVTRDDAAVGGEVEVVLAAKVRWIIRFSGYSAERIVDLSAGRVRGIEIVGGTRRAELTLAQAAGTVPMKITGGMEELILRAPNGSPVRIKVGGGAGSVTAGSRTLRDVAPGSTLTPKDWTTGNRYDVDAVAPVTLLTVETT